LIYVSARVGSPVKVAPITTPFQDARKVQLKQMIAKAKREENKDFATKLAGEL
jgi:hypothetical protein